MGTLRDEMSRVLNEWDKQDQQPSQEKTMEKRVTTTQKIVNIIAANPGITSKAIYKLVEDKHHDIPLGNVSSILTQLTGRYVLSREQSGEVVHGKVIYAYTVIPEEQGKALRDAADKKLKAAQARMEKARQIKAAKQAAREQLDKMLAEREQEQAEERTGLSDLLPQATTAIHNTAPPVIKSTWSAKEALDGLSVLQARELYGELKQIFGG
jgi:hypothetical protein